MQELGYKISYWLHGGGVSSKKGCNFSSMKVTTTIGGNTTNLNYLKQNDSGEPKHYHRNTLKYCGINLGPFPPFVPLVFC